MAYTAIDKPTDYFETLTWTGNGGTLNITGLDFSPGLIWAKSRSDARSHILCDVVRGATKELSSNADTLEGTVSTGITAFNSDGFSLGGGGDTNNNSSTFVSWNWAAGTSVSGNTTGSGSATAYSGSVNTTAGFSIITYEANGSAGHTIPHHLGAAPSMVICKSRSENRGFPIQHASLTSAAYAIYLSTTGAEANNGSDQSTNTWNSTAASSTVVTLGNNANNNKNGDDYIMYSFAEKQGYSKIGSYTGNGNADGAFVYTGFKPAMIITKRTDAAADWFIRDNKQDPENVMNEYLSPSSTAVSGDLDSFDFVSNGFKIRNNNNAWNGDGNSYVYMAFAESPFVNSNGIPNNAG